MMKSTKRQTFICLVNERIYEIPVFGDWLISIQNIQTNKEHLVVGLKRIGFKEEWNKIIRELINEGVIEHL